MEIAKWRCRKSCTRSELQSLIDQLQHAATVVKPGRTFLQRMYDLLKVGTAWGKQTLPGGQYLRLNLEFRSDLAWWSQFLCQWNGVSLLTASNSHLPDTHITSDASGAWVWGILGEPMAAMAVGSICTGEINHCQRIDSHYFGSSTMGQRLERSVCIVQVR